MILGSAGLARKVLLAHNPAMMHLEQIERASRRAAELCRQLLAYAGQSQTVSGKTDLNGLIRNSTALFGVSAAKSVTLRLDLQDGLPPVAADPASLRQVLVNLAMNAVEALGDKGDKGDKGELGGEVVVATDLTEVGPGARAGFHLPPSPGRYVRLVVSDNGPGIPPEIQSRMFDPFFTTRFAGRGLGLAAVLGIMRAHRGAIRVNSERGKGTSVEVFWPEGNAKRNGDRATPPTMGKALVVDDEMYVREMAASTVQELGFEPLLAADGVTALELFRENWGSIRVAVLDVVIPGMSGDQLLREIRALELSLPAVLVSGFSDRHALASVLGSGTEFLQKPFHPEELIAAIQRVLPNEG